MKFAQRDCPKLAEKPGGGCRETPKFCGRHIMEAHLGTVLGPSKNLVCPSRVAGRAPNGPHLADCSQFSGAAADEGLRGAQTDGRTKICK